MMSPLGRPVEYLRAAFLITYLSERALGYW
jgi:hypothetical protein